MMTRITQTILLFVAILTSSLGISQELSIEWQNTIGGSGEDLMRHIIPTDDGGYLAAGFSNSGISGDKTENSQGGNDYWVLKLDETGSIVWQNTIGGNGDDNLRSVIQTADGGFVVAGDSDSGVSGDKTEASLGGTDYWVLKLDSSGSIVWQNTIGGSGDEILVSIKETSDNGYILGGFSDSNVSGDKSENSIGGDDYWAVKLDASGSVEWENTVGGDLDDFLFSAIEISTGGFLLAGRSGSSIFGDKTDFSRGLDDYWVVKLDASGVIDWDRTIGGDNFDDLRDAIETADGGFVLMGSSASTASGDKTENTNGSYDYWVVKIDDSGNILWQNAIGGSGTDFGFFLTPGVDEGFVLSGYSDSSISGDKTEPSRGAEDYWLVKIDDNGTVVRDKTIGGAGSDQARGNVVQTPDGNYVMGGFSDSGATGDKTEASNGGNDYWLLKLRGGELSVDDNMLREKIMLFNDRNNEVLTIINQSAELLQSIQIYTMTGALVIQKALNSTANQIPLDVSQLSSGMYLLNAMTDRGKITLRFIKN